MPRSLPALAALIGLAVAAAPAAATPLVLGTHGGGIDHVTLSGGGALWTTPVTRGAGTAPRTIKRQPR